MNHRFAKLIAYAAGLVMVSAVAMPHAAGAADPAAAFALEHIGAAHGALAHLLPADCMAVCALTSPAGEVLPGVIASRAELHFDDGLLQRVDVVFDEAQYEAAIAALQARFGAGEDRHFRARAGMGAAELIAGVMLWRRADLIIVAEQFAGKIDRSRLCYGTPRAMRATLEEITARPVGARRDF